MTKPFDPTKPVQTRGGQEARIICTDRPGHMTIVALVGGDSRITTHRSDGSYHEYGGQHHDDLINIPTKVTKYVHVKRGSLFAAMYETHDQAAREADPGMVVATVTWEE